MAMVSQLRTKRAFCNDGNVLDTPALSNMVSTENLQHGWCDLGIFQVYLNSHMWLGATIIT